MPPNLSFIHRTARGIAWSNCHSCSAASKPADLAEQTFGVNLKHYFDASTSNIDSTCELTETSFDFSCSHIVAELIALKWINSVGTKSFRPALISKVPLLDETRIQVQGRRPGRIRPGSEPRDGKPGQPSVAVMSVQVVGPDARPASAFRRAAAARGTTIRRWRAEIRAGRRGPKVREHAVTCLCGSKAGNFISRNACVGPDWSAILRKTMFSPNTSMLIIRAFVAAPAGRRLGALEAVGNARLVRLHVHDRGNPSATSIAVHCSAASPVRMRRH